MQEQSVKSLEHTMSISEKQIDSMIEKALSAPIHTPGRQGVDEPGTEGKPTADLKTIWPIIKLIFTFIRPLLFFKPKWRDIIDKFLLAMDIMIPAA